MDLLELKNIWAEYDKRLDKSLQLNMQLLRKMNLDKVGNKAKTIFVFKLLEMAILLAIMAYLYNFAIQNFTTPQFSVSAFVVAGFITAGFISDIRQLIIITQIRSDYAAPIAPIQKKLTKLKLLIVNYVKYSLLGVPFFPFLTILAGKILFDMDFWQLKRHLYIITNIAFGVVLLPIFIWVFVQLSKGNVQQKWTRLFFAGSGWNQAIAAEKFLKEIDDFERDDV